MQHVYAGYLNVIRPSTQQHVVVHGHSGSAAFCTSLEQFKAAHWPYWYELPSNTTRAYDLHEPTWNCEVKERVPPSFGDGPKHVCGVDAIKKRTQCLVYSFGSNGVVDFETAIKARLPNCEIHTFDPFIHLASREHKLRQVTNAQQRSILTYHNLGLVGDGQKLSFKNEMLPSATFNETLQTLRHERRTVDILKVDIEGSEYSALGDRSLFGGCMRADHHHRTQIPVRQLQVEVHGQNFTRIFRLVEQMHACGLALFSKESNHWGCDGYRCVELSFISPEHAWEAYKLSHPSCDDPYAALGGRRV